MSEKKQEPTKAQKKQFTKGFKWGKIEHKLETYTTYTLLIGILIQIVGILSKMWFIIFVASGFFGIAFVFRFFAGTAHKLEKHYMDKLRFGKWKKKEK